MMRINQITQIYKRLCKNLLKHNLEFSKYLNMTLIVKNNFSRFGKIQDKLISQKFMIFNEGIFNENRLNNFWPL